MVAQKTRVWVIRLRESFLNGLGLYMRIRTVEFSVHINR